MKKERVFNKMLVIKLWREGLTVGDIARKLDADIRIVSDITEEYEAKRRGNVPLYNEEGLSNEEEERIMDC